MSKTRSLHHIVFATKRREMTITEEYKKELYAYIFGIIQNSKCFLHRMNGTPNHIHMLIDVSPTIAVADLVKKIKQYSSLWIKTNPHFQNFDSWGEGYYAFSIGPETIESCKNYIINQEVHHKGVDLLIEMEQFAKLNNMNWHPADWD